MEFIVWVETRLGGQRLEIREVAKVEREATGIGPEELGLTLADGKTVLKQVQERIVQIQIEALSAAAKACRNCGRNQRMKDLRKRQLRTVFGAVAARRSTTWDGLRSARSFTCTSDSPASSGPP